MKATTRGTRMNYKKVLFFFQPTDRERLLRTKPSGIGRGSPRMTITIKKKVKNPATMPSTRVKPSMCLPLPRFCPRALSCAEDSRPTKAGRFAIACTLTPAPVTDLAARRRPMAGWENQVSRPLSTCFSAWDTGRSAPESDSFPKTTQSWGSATSSRARTRRGGGDGQIRRRAVSRRVRMTSPAII